VNLAPVGANNDGSKKGKEEERKGKESASTPRVVPFNFSAAVAPMRMRERSPLSRVDVMKISYSMVQDA